MGLGVIPLVLSLIFPACGKPGAEGIKPPAIDFKALTLPRTPNYALAAPVGYTPAPEFITPRYLVPAARLFTALARVAASQPRTFALESHAKAGQAAWVARSRVANFPDIIEASVAPAASGGRTLILYSHSVYGRGDFGVNKARIKVWLMAIGRQAEDGDMERTR